VCEKYSEERNRTPIDPNNHNYDSGVVTKEPTCVDGVKTYTCRRCGHTKTESIPATMSHLYSFEYHPVKAIDPNLYYWGCDRCNSAHHPHYK
jgi:hypothetical protein